MAGIPCGSQFGSKVYCNFNGFNRVRNPVPQLFEVFGNRFSFLLKPPYVYPTRAGIRHHNDEVLNKAIQIACTTSIPNAKSNKPVVKIYPNPANDAITINATGLSSATITFQVTDVCGRVLMQRTVENNQQKVFTTFDVSNLYSGIYFLNIIGNDQSIVSKFIKK